MRPWDYLPASHRPPLREDLYCIAWQADLGSGTPPAVIAEYIDAFATVLDIGERWGIVMAEEAAARSLLVELFAAAHDGEPRWLVSNRGSAGDLKMASAQDRLCDPISIPDDANDPSSLRFAG